MFNQKGFTLIELVVVLVIVAILAAIAIPNYSSMVEQGAATAAQNNLVTIYNAQKTIYLNTGNYYISAACPDTLANINNNNTGLSLNLSDSNFTYCCTNAGGFQCTATGFGKTLTLTNNPLVLPGAAGALNPGCAPVGVPCPS